MENWTSCHGCSFQNMWQYNMTSQKHVWKLFSPWNNCIASICSCISYYKLHVPQLLANRSTKPKFNKRRLRALMPYWILTLTLLDSMRWLEVHKVNAVMSLILTNQKGANVTKLDSQLLLFVLGPIWIQKWWLHALELPKWKTMEIVFCCRGLSQRNLASGVGIDVMLLKSDGRTTKLSL